ncbi:MAG: alkaline phosphatase family protein [Bacteroidetes bacterium]|nr:alkaline phosphatase family protein [Bacteroidota bacterium]
MKNWIWLLLVLVGVKATAQPKLAIGIVVDQMRYDYLLRYADRYCDSGFKRLMGEGYVFTNARYDYVPTYTGPGHASIYTGTTPANHGIVANDWYDRQRGDMMYCAEDSLSELIGGRGMAMSPRNLLANTMTDQLAIASKKRSKIIGISIKDRGAILPAGHAANGAYWYDSKSGKLQSSDWYGDALPHWVEAFNRRGLALKYLDQTWNTLFPIESYMESSADSNGYEGSLQKGKAPVFPYDLREIQKERGYGLLSFTPFGNQYLVEATLAALDGEKMGADEICDFLCLSFSCTDYAGHFFGPQSVEVEDIYLRLDREIARLLYELDQKVGSGNYTVFLTADHGANQVPSYLQSMGMPGGLFEIDSVAHRIEQAMMAKYQESFLLRVFNEQVYLNKKRIREKGLPLGEVEELVADALKEMPGVFATWTPHDVWNGATDYLAHIRNGYMPSRSGDLFIQFLPGWMEHWPYGTSHGSGYTYDTHVPVLFYGYGVPKGRSNRRISTTDIAPSMCEILHISFPNACTGNPLSELGTHP